MSLKRGLHFTRMQEKSNAHVYLFVFIFRNAKYRLVIVCFTRTRRPFDTISSDVKRRGGISEVFVASTAETCGLPSSRVISLLNYAWNSDSSLSEVENWRKKWLTFDAEVDDTVRVFCFRFEESETHQFSGISGCPWNIWVLLKTRRRKKCYRVSINEDGLFLESPSVGKIFCRRQW